MHQNIVPSLRVTCVLALIACSSSPSSGPDAGNDAAPPSAPDEFWNAMWSGDLAAGASQITPLESLASSSNPPDWYTTLLVGEDAAWQIVESDRNPSTASQAAQTYAPIALQYLQQAHALNPDDAFTTAMAGYILFSASAQTNDPTGMAQGKALVDQAFTSKPETGWFLELILAQPAPVNDPQMKTAVDAGWTYYSTCGGVTVDPQAPNFAPYVTQAEAPTRAFCGNSSLAPHVLEGGLLYFGDLLVKAGNVAAAKVAYAAAQSSPTYAAWPHHDVVDARLGTDLDARAASYQGDPSGWPTFAATPYACGTCHNR